MTKMIPPKSKLQIRQASGLGRVRFPLSPVCLLFMGSPPLSPMVDIWGRNVKGRNASPSNHDPSYGLGVLTVIDPFGGASHNMPLNFSSENKIEIKNEWEA